ncbi:MAG: oxidoreductase [Planctomycetota bacterium]|nr:MAG: oxidoreductase [Planctomycetota bacterium]
MKLCFIGNRGHNGYVLDGLKLLDDIEVVGITRSKNPDETKYLEEVVSDLKHSPSIYDDFEKMLEECQPDIVSVCGPLEDHAKHCIACIKRDIHVISEKTIALTINELNEIKETYQRHPVKLIAMMGLRFSSEFYTAKKLILKNKIGSIRLLNSQKSYRLGTRAEHFKQRNSSGGTIPWVGSHAIDLVYWLSGQEFKSVSAIHTTKENKSCKEMEMTALCQFSMTEDVFASVTMDYLRPQNANTHGDDRIRIMGTDGALEARDGKLFLINSEQNGESEIQLEHPPQMFCDFVASIKGENDQPVINTMDTFKVTEASLIARDAADEHIIKYID